MNRTQKGLSLVELLLIMVIVFIVLGISLPLLIANRQAALLREVRSTHPNAVEFVSAQRDAAAHYVVTVKNSDGSTSTYTLDK